MRLSVKPKRPFWAEKLLLVQRDKATSEQQDAIICMEPMPQKCVGVPDMVPMYIGLLADAALASWHAGDRETCLRDMVIVLEKLSALDSKSSLRAAHCHAVSRHVLLWLDQEATGEVRYIEKRRNSTNLSRVSEQPRTTSGHRKAFFTRFGTFLVHARSN